MPEDLLMIEPGQVFSSRSGLEMITVFNLVKTKLLDRIPVSRSLFDPSVSENTFNAFRFGVKATR
jgi:hypothetical protein